MDLDAYDILFICSAFLFQIVLIIHFALRKWKFDIAVRYGPLVYALGIPAAIVSLLLILAGKPWSFWLSGFLYPLWGIYGYVVEYVRRIQWRNPARWSVLIPYLCLYLATILFYWFPLALLYKPLWYMYGVLFLASTALNLTSHKTSKGQSLKP
ncbi:MAG: hypothetical protein ABFD58_12020 [Anaerolineaceae bacterium]